MSSQSTFQRCRFNAVAFAASCILCAGIVGEGYAQTKPTLQAKSTGIKKAFVRGVVFGQDNVPLAGAKVQIGGQPVVTTNSDGGFRVLLEPGQYAMMITAPGYRDARVNALVIARASSVEVVVTMSKSGKASVNLEGVPVLDNTPKAPVTVDKKVAQAPGKIVGQVLNLKRRPIPGARIYVRGLAIEVRSDAKGRFVLEVPAGEHQISVIHSDYSAQSVPDIKVKPRQRAEVLVEMTPVAMELEAFTVTAPRIEGNTATLLNTRKQAATMNDVLGAEQFSKSGDSSAASALKRVTGLTVVGGKYVYVRGLGERYSSTLLNGATLPSPEPERRVVPLDMFATSLLESVTIQKTYSPDKPGEFGGGVVGLKTRSFPKQFQASLKLSGGYLTGTTFEQGGLGPRGSLDWLGFDDGTRALPSIVKQASEKAPLKQRGRFDTNGYSDQQLQIFGRAMPNNWAYTSRTLPPNMGLSATIGDKFSLFGKRSGLRAALTYSNGWSLDQTRRAFYRVGANDRLEVRNEYDFDETGNNITTGAMLTGGIQLDATNKLAFTSMVNRVTDDEGRVYSGFNRDAGTNIRITRLRWLERTLIFQQLTGEHGFGDAKTGSKLTWRYVFSQARRSEPDRRQSRYDFEGNIDDFLLSDLPEGNSRVYSTLRDNNHDFGVNYTMPYGVWGNRLASLKFGTQMVFKDRKVDTRRFKYFGRLNDAQFRLAPQNLFIAKNIGPDKLQFGEITRATDNYGADQKIFGGFVMTDLPLTTNIKIQTGVRLEYSDQLVETFELFNAAATPIQARLTTFDALPALNATWSLSKKMNVRGALSRTVSRPDFRELSPAAFNDVAGGSSIEGNPELERGIIYHADLRWAWYPRLGESISLSVFGKAFDQPIEMVLIPGAQRTVTFRNAQSANNIGLEVEARKNLDVLWSSLRDFYISGNLALIRSRVSLKESDDTVLTATERALQGQSPYVINGQFGYDNVESGTTISVLYNVYGPRIMEVGALGAPDIYQQPFHQLDVVASKRMGRWNFGVSAKNLINQTATFSQGDSVTESVVRGRAFSASVGMQF